MSWQLGFCQTKEDADLQTKVATSKTIQSSNRSGFLSYSNFAKLNATNDGTSAEANIDYSLNAWNLNVNASTPVSSKTQRVKPLTLSGLSNNSALTIGVQKIQWGKGFAWTDSKSYAEGRKAIGKDTGDFSTNDLTKEEKAKFYNVASAGIDWGYSLFYGAKLGIEQQEFNYVTNQATFDNEEVTKTAINVSGSLGLLNDFGIWAITFTHQDGYQAGNPIKYYIPINGTGVQVEKSLSPNAPQQQNSEKLRIEFLSNGKPKLKDGEVRQSPFRINPNLNFEFNQQIFSFEFPVYFLTSNDERTSFNGGIYTGYVSDEHFNFNIDKRNFGFGVFIGANFTKLFE